MTDDSLCSVLHQDGCYSLSLLQTLNIFRQEDVLCDVILLAKGDAIKAHRLVLAACSVYFKAMFAGDLAEKTQETVEMHEVEPLALKAVINYAYTSEIKVNESNVQSIMSCASMLQMTSVITACSDFLSSRLHPSNCLGIQQFAALYSCQDLESKAKLYSQEHFKEVAAHDEFLMLPQSALVHLVSSDRLDVESEGCVFAAIVCWVKVDPATRYVYLMDLLHHVRFHLLSPSFIQGQADLEPMLADFAVKYASSTSGDLFNWPNAETSARFSKTQQVIFALGGESTGFPLTSVQSFVPEGHCWQNALPTSEPHSSTQWQEPIAGMGTARTSFGAVADGQYIYAAGGTTSVQALDTVEVYSSTKNAWNPLTPMAQGRNGCKAALLNGVLYVVGGHDGFVYLNTLEAYQYEGDSWKSCAPMMFPRGFGCCGVISGMLYVMGGTGGNANEADVYHSEMERYDPGQDLWTTMAPMKDARAYFAAVVVNKCLYAIGGFNGRWLNTVEKYDPRTNKWQYMRALSIPRSSFSATVHNGCIYVAGGFTGKKNVNTVEKYDPCTDRWSMVCAMPMCRYGLQLVTVDVPCRKYEDT